MKAILIIQIESFLQLYTHLVPPNDLQPVTDILVFQARISKPGIWEVMPEYVIYFVDRLLNECEGAEGRRAWGAEIDGWTLRARGLEYGLDWSWCSLRVSRLAQSGDTKITGVSELLLELHHSGRGICQSLQLAGEEQGHASRIQHNEAKSSARVPEMGIGVARRRGCKT